MSERALMARACAVGERALIVRWSAFSNLPLGGNFLISSPQANRGLLVRQPSFHG
jgi:hypothetical protein